MGTILVGGAHRIFGYLDREAELKSLIARTQDLEGFAGAGLYDSVTVRSCRDPGARVLEEIWKFPKMRGLMALLMSGLMALIMSSLLAPVMRGLIAFITRTPAKRILVFVPYSLRAYQKH